MQEDKHEGRYSGLDRNNAFNVHTFPDHHPVVLCTTVFTDAGAALALNQLPDYPTLRGHLDADMSGMLLTALFRFK